MKAFLNYLWEDAPDLWAALAVFLFITTVYLTVTP